MLDWGSLWHRHGWRKGWIKYSLAFFGASPSKHMKRKPFLILHYHDLIICTFSNTQRLTGLGQILVEREITFSGKQVVETQLNLFWKQPERWSDSRKGFFWAHVVIWIFSGRVMLDLPWGSSTAMISARPPFPASRLSTWALRICASSNPCWRSGWVTQVGDITCRYATSLGQDERVHPGTSNKGQENRSWS